jgi:hypothetical protein
MMVLLAKKIRIGLDKLAVLDGADGINGAFGRLAGNHCKLAAGVEQLCACPLWVPTTGTSTERI